MLKLQMAALGHLVQYLLLEICSTKSEFHILLYYFSIIISRFSLVSALAMRDTRFAFISCIFYKSCHMPKNWLLVCQLWQMHEFEFLALAFFDIFGFMKKQVLSFSFPFFLKKTDLSFFLRKHAIT